VRLKFNGMTLRLPWQAMRQGWINLLIAISVGYILFFFSERLFWTVWWPDNSLVDLFVTWLAYSAVTYLFLALVSWSRANDVWSVFLAGAVYGWLVEGGLANTLYGTQASAPFPISIAVTALSWHALISVMIGWWATGRAVGAATVTPLVGLSLASGVFWGVWAMFPRRETPPVMTPVHEFLINACSLTLILLPTWWLSLNLQLKNFRPGVVGLALSGVLVGAFYVAHVLALGAVVLVVFPTVLLSALVPLCCHRKVTASTTSNLFPETVRWRRLAVVAITPVVSTVVYAVAAATAMDQIPQVTLLVYVATGVIGAALFAVSFAMTIRKTVLQARRSRGDTDCN
jgi:hypothetical protein